MCCGCFAVVMWLQWIVLRNWWRKTCYTQLQEQNSQTRTSLYCRGLVARLLFIIINVMFFSYFKAVLHILFAENILISYFHYREEQASHLPMNNCQVWKPDQCCKLNMETRMSLMLQNLYFLFMRKWPLGEVSNF